MKRKIFAVISFLLIASVSAINTNAGSTEWTGVRDIIHGVRTSTALVEVVMDIAQELDEHGITSGTLHLFGYTGGYTDIVMSLSDSSGSYDKILEIWTSPDSGITWNKGLELSYNSENQGEFIFKPRPFDSSEENSLICKFVFDHAEENRNMSVMADFGAGVDNVEIFKADVTDTGEYVTVYFTARLNVSVTELDILSGEPWNNDTAVNDVYTFGAKISSDDPYYATAKHGVQDQGEALGFGLYDSTLPWNAGLFNRNGFVSDCSAGGGDYPLASDIVASNLPQEEELSGVSFNSTADPDLSGALTINVNP